MAEALVSEIQEIMASIIQLHKEVKLVMGVDDEVEKLTNNFKIIGAVLEDAERRRFEELAVSDWLDTLKDTSYEIYDVLDEWKTLIGKLQINTSEPSRKVSSLIPNSGFCCNLVMPHHIAHKLKDLNGKLDDIALKKEKFEFNSTGGAIERKQPVNMSINDYVDNVSEVYGRENDKANLLKLLLSSSQAAKIPTIISIVGIGGIGKTTLAQFAFNNDEVNTHFEQKIWVCVSKPFDEIRIAKAIFESVVGSMSKPTRLQIMLEEIRKSLEGKKFLLVLDDVWSEDPNEWEQLKGSLRSGSRESRILVTTRSKDVANSIGTTNREMILLEKLSETDSLLLFSQIAFKRTEKELEAFKRTEKELEDVGQKILGKCNGLPLAIKTLGSLLRFKSSIEEWQSVLNSEMWEIKQERRGIFLPLLLSYFDLPSSLRKCFSHCVVFPKNSDIEKDRLIKLWMAQSFLKKDQTKDMESFLKKDQTKDMESFLKKDQTKDMVLIGEEYFENLAMHSFFQDFKRNKFDGTIESCKMHDLVHDFAQFLSKNECFSIDIDDFEETEAQFSPAKAQYLMIELKNGDSFPTHIYKAKKVHSLLVKFENMSKSTVSKLFDNFACLRRLELICFNNDMWHSMGIKELPLEIEKLVHLRYLDLSNNNRLENLPETLCELYNLQTLNLKNCWALKKLPQQMGRLINLRHLLNDGTCHNSLSEIPKGIEGLTRLQTLKEFSVCRKSEGTKASSLEYLGHLNNLQGSLDIVGLGDVGNVFEVNKANLEDKKYILSLGLYFRRHHELRVNRDGIDEDKILEALQPPPNLDTVVICYYQGKSLSSKWMVSLTKLRFLTLGYCISLECLPPLGKLSSLESLHISCMKQVERVGSEFLGMERDGTSAKPFPNLKFLQFYEMKKWEEWDMAKTSDGTIIEVMPSLSSLSIKFCKTLKSLPEHILKLPTLKQLKIIGCPILEEQYNKETRTDWHQISHIPRIKIRQ